MKASIFILPVFISSILVFGLIKRVNVYDCFIEGVKSTTSILPALVGLMVAISMLRESGAVELIANAVGAHLEKVGLSPEVLPLALLRPISGSASLAVVTDIFKNCGVDSKAGLVASVMMGSTETTFYTVAVYYGAAKVKNIRYTLVAALIADITAIICSIIVCRLFFRI